MNVTAKREGTRRSGDEVARLVKQAAAGRQPAWDALVDEFGGMIWAIARAHRLDPADAADVAQTTWLRLLENLDRLSDPTRAGSWLATTARRECLRLLRHGQRHVLTDDERLAELPSDEESLDDRVLRSERDAALWRGFGRLRPTDQALLRLLTSDAELAYEDISAALDMPIGSIGPTRGRALVRLRRELDRDGTLALVGA